MNIYLNDLGHITKIAARAINSKILLKTSFLEPETPHIGKQTLYKLSFVYVTSYVAYILNSITVRKLSITFISMLRTLIELYCLEVL